MKNKDPLMKGVIALVALFLTVMFLVSYAGAGREYVAESTAEEIKDDDNDKVHYENIAITYEMQMPKDIPEQIRLAVIELPVPVIKKFIEDEWKISVVSVVKLPENTNIDATVDKKDTVVGVTNYQTKTIQVLYDDKQQSVTTSVMHELCHFCDKYYGETLYPDDSLYDKKPDVYLVSYTDRFKEIYKGYKTAYIEYEKSGIAKTKENDLDFEYPVSNSEEFFACSLKDYFLHPKYLQDNYPEIYGYFAKEMISEYKR